LLETSTKGTIYQIRIHSKRQEESHFSFTRPLSKAAMNTSHYTSAIIIELD